LHINNGLIIENLEKHIGKIQKRKKGKNNEKVKNAGIDRNRRSRREREGGRGRSASPIDKLCDKNTGNCRSGSDNNSSGDTVLSKRVKREQEV